MVIDIEKEMVWHRWSLSKIKKWTISRILEITTRIPAAPNWVKNNSHAHPWCNHHSFSLHYLFVIYHLFSIAHWSFHPFSERERKRRKEWERKQPSSCFIYIFASYTTLYTHPIVILMMNIGVIIHKVRNAKI